MSAMLISCFFISANSNRVVYMASQETNFVSELYGVPITGGVVQKLNSPLTAGGDVESYEIASNSNHVVYQADKETVGVFELYVSLNEFRIFLPVITR